MQLALRGEDVAQLQFWRGDKNPEGAFTYLQDKGDLVRELAKGNEEASGGNIKKGIDGELAFIAGQMAVDAHIVQERSLLKLVLSLELKIALNEK